MKICNKCKIEKELNLFSKCLSNKDNLQKSCKECLNKYNLNRNNNDKVKLSRKLYQKNYNILNQDKINRYNKLWNVNNTEYFKNYKKDRYHNDIEFKIKSNLRSRIFNGLKTARTNKNNKTINYIGCSVKEFIQHIEQQFKPEMSWDNHGTIWEIDHIKSCSKFDLTKEEEQEKCFHYTNMQPLFKTTQIAESFGYTNEIGNRNKGKYN